MIKITRSPIPGFLAANAAQWNTDFVQRRTANPKYQFSWCSYQNKPVNEHLEPILLEMTARHCAFCDGYELGGNIKPTIEHFRPKSRFPSLAYEWANLFPACHYCQEKRDEFDEKLLKPDEDDYAFERYFYFENNTGELIPNPQATPADQERAAKTIELYRLNGSERRTICSLRQRCVKQFRAGLYPPNEITMYPYRYLYQVGNEPPI